MDRRKILFIYNIKYQGRLSDEGGYLKKKTVDYLQSLVIYDFQAEKVSLPCIHISPSYKKKGNKKSMREKEALFGCSKWIYDLNFQRASGCGLHTPPFHTAQIYMVVMGDEITQDTFPRKVKGKNKGKPEREKAKEKDSAPHVMMGERSPTPIPESNA